MIAGADAGHCLADRRDDSRTLMTEDCGIGTCDLNVKSV